MKTNPEFRKKVILITIAVLAVVIAVITYLAVLFIRTPYSGQGRKDLTWLCIGDSITLGETNHDISYADYVGKITGVKLIKEGHSGYTADRLLNEIDEIDAPADIVTVFAGSNDWVYDKPVGTVNDNTTDTFCGAVNLFMAYLKEKHPDSEIYFLTPIFRYKQYSESLPFAGLVNPSGDSVDTYVNAMIECGEKNDVPVINLYYRSGIGGRNYKWLTTDGTHPNALGQLRIMLVVRKYIK